MRLSRRAANKEASYQVAQAADIMARRATSPSSNPIGPRVFFKGEIFKSAFLKVFLGSIFLKAHVFKIV